MALDIESAKREATALTEYFLTQGKRLKRTQALDAIACIKGFDNWLALKAAAPASVAPTTSLAEMFLNKELDDIVITGVRFSVQTCNEVALQNCVQQALHTRRASDAPMSAEELKVGVIRTRCEDPRYAGVPMQRWITVEELLFAKPRGAGWTLGGSGDFLAAFVQEVVTPELALAA